MSYKDKEAQKKAAKERMRRYRENKKGVTKEDVTPSVTPDKYDLFVEAVEKIDPIILSDGQAWYPGNNGYHPKSCTCKRHRDRTGLTNEQYCEGVLI